MHKLTGIAAGWLLSAAVCAPAMHAQVSVRQVKVLDAKGAVEIEVETSDRIVPQTQVLTGPDRLVIDFPNAVPGAQVRSQSVYKGEVKDVRVGLFQSNPPVTRVVLDLNSAQPYQVFPYGRTVMIKVEGGGDEDADDAAPRSGPSLVTANYTTSAEKIEDTTPPRSVLDVSFRQGLLAIKANKATLSDVLFAVQQRTGAEVAIAAGADQEKVVADLGPGPAPDVLSRLLNGSKFNFMILSAANDPQKLERVILSPRNESAVVVPQPPAQNEVEDDEPPTAPPAAQVKTPPTNNPPSPAPNIPNMPVENKIPPDDNPPPQ